MKIVKPINITDEVLIDSSIPIPDAARGEEEWQEESARTFELHSVQVLNGNYIDSVSITENGDRFLFVLSGNYQDGFFLAKYDNSGGLVSSIGVTQRPGYDKSEPVAISVISSTGMIAISMVHILDAFGGDKWEFSYYSVNASLSSQTSHVNISFSGKYDNYGGQSIFRYKVFDGGIIMLARDDDWVSISDTEAAFFAGSSPPKVIPNFPMVDACIAGDSVYFLSSGSFVEGGQRYNTVFIHDLNMARAGGKVIKNISSGEFPFLKPSINSHGGFITHSLVNNILIGKDEIATQVYDLNMINIGSYKRNDEVIKSSTKRKYRCAVDATFDDPELGVNLSPPTWVDIGAVNRWMPFDRQPAQQAVSDDPVYYKLKPGEFIRTLSIFNISRVTNVNVKVTDPVDGVIYDKDFDLVDNSNVVDMWTYLTLPISFKKELIITDLVCFRDSEIEITINGDNPAVGAIVTGNESPAGRCVTGTGVRSNQFSVRKENGFGGFDIIQRGVGKIVRFRVAYDISQIEYLTNLLESIDSVYCVFIGDLPDGKVISVYGVLDPYQSDFETPTVNTLEFDVLGVL